MIECQANYAIDCIRQVIKSGGRSIEVRTQPFDKYQEYLQSEMKSTVFSSGCLSWYRNDRGVQWILWPGNLTRFWWQLVKCEPEDYIVKK